MITKACIEIFCHLIAELFSKNDVDGRSMHHVNDGNVKKNAMLEKAKMCHNQQVSSPVNKIPSVRLTRADGGWRSKWKQIFL